MFRPPNTEGANLSGLGFIHDFTFCHDKEVLLWEVNISSGIGISRTVSSPSSRSKLGQSFLIRPKQTDKTDGQNGRKELNKERKQWNCRIRVVGLREEGEREGGVRRNTKEKERLRFKGRVPISPTDRGPFPTCSALSIS